MMKRYVLIESRDPYEYADVGYFYRMASDLAQRSHNVTLYLIQNGVLAARKGAQGPLQDMLKAGGSIAVLADDFSLKERAISQGALAPHVAVSNVDSLVDMLTADGVSVVWH